MSFYGRLLKFINLLTIHNCHKVYSGCFFFFESYFSIVCRDKGCRWLQQTFDEYSKTKPIWATTVWGLMFLKRLCFLFFFVLFFFPPLSSVCDITTKSPTILIVVQLTDSSAYWQAWPLLDRRAKTLSSTRNWCLYASELQTAKRKKKEEEI